MIVFRLESMKFDNTVTSRELVEKIFCDEIKYKDDLFSRSSSIQWISSYFEAIYNFYHSPMSFHATNDPFESPQDFMIELVCYIANFIIYNSEEFENYKKTGSKLTEAYIKYICNDIRYNYFSCDYESDYMPEEF